MDLHRVPMLPEELDRKTVEATEQIIRQLEAGLVTAHFAERQLYLLWSVTAGLAANDVSTLVQQAHQAAQAQVKPEPPEQITLYRATDGRLARITFALDKPGFAVELFTTGGVQTSEQREIQPGAERAAAVKRVITQLVATGMRPLPAPKYPF